MRKILLSLLLSLLLLVGCVSKTPPSPAPSAEGEIIGYTLLDAKTAVLTADTTLSDCYSYTLKEGYGTPGTNDAQFYLWMELDFQQELSQGDIVAVLDEKDGVSRVVIPYGDLPWLYGYVSSDFLSMDASDIGSGKQAILQDCEAYDSPDGTRLHYVEARVSILVRDGEWANVQEYGTGADPYWVHTTDLSFDFDTSLPDWPK